MEPDVTPGKLHRMIAAEDKLLADVVAFIHDGQRNGKLSDVSAEALVDEATRQHDSNIKVLRQALAAELRREWLA